MRQIRGSGRRARRSAGVAMMASAALLLAGCGEAEDTPVLTWYTNPDDGGQAAIAEQCSDEAGGAYRIETSILPNDAASQREQLTRRLAAEDTSMDIMSLDPPFIPELAEPGFIAVPPDDVVERTTQDTLEGALAGATWRDTVVTVPFWANTQLLWYRESVAEAAGLDMSQPVTWDQLIEVARDQGLYLGVQGARAESMTVWLNALIESGGESILANPEAPSSEVQTNLDSEAGIKAAEVISTIGQEGLGSPGLPTQQENESLIVFEGQSGSFMVNWPFVWPAMNASVEQGALSQEFLDDVAWTTYPRLTADEPAAPPLGGINLGVGAASDQQDLAWDAIECIVSPENQATYFVTNGNPPSSEQAYGDSRIEEQFPMAPLIRDSLELAAPRPLTPYYNEVSTGIQQGYTPPSDVDPETTPAETGQFIEEVLRGERLL